MGSTMNNSRHKIPDPKNGFAAIRLKQPPDTERSHGSSAKNQRLNRDTEYDSCPCSTYVRPVGGAVNHATIHNILMLEKFVAEVQKTRKKATEHAQLENRKEREARHGGES